MKSKTLEAAIDLETWDCLFQSHLEAAQRPERWTLGLHVDGEAGLGWSQYTLHAFASFRCYDCDRRWDSARVRIIYHIKIAAWAGEENFVNMRIFKQECQRCGTGELEEPQFIIENVDIAMEHLVTRILWKCYGEDVSGRPVRDFITNGRSNGCHDSAHCEACRAGLCRLKRPEYKQDGQAALSQGESAIPPREVRDAPPPPYNIWTVRAASQDHHNPPVHNPSTHSNQPNDATRETDPQRNRTRTSQDHHNPLSTNPSTHSNQPNDATRETEPQRNRTRTSQDHHNPPVHNPSTHSNQPNDATTETEPQRNRTRTSCCPCVLL
ncbi:receptor-transporting protein 2-like [Lissotriton helveticus]